MKSAAYKLYLLLSKLYLKLIMRCQTTIFRLASIKILQCLLLTNDRISIAKKQKMSHLICIKYLHSNELEEYIKLADEEPELAQEAEALIKERMDIRELLADYYRVISFYFDIAGNSEYARSESEKYFGKAKEFNVSVEKLERKRFTEISKKVQKEYRKTRKELKVNLKNLIETAVYEDLPKIEITPNHVNFILSISATIFILTGYLYNRYYLGHYGIEVSYYFTMSDYISSSIDKIYIACIPVILSVVAFIKGMIDGKRRAVESVQLEIVGNISDVPMTIFVIAMTLFTIYTFYLNLPGKYLYLSMLVLFASVGICIRLPIEKIIKNSNYVKITCIAIIVFFVEIFWVVTNDIDKINRVDAVNYNKYKFNYKSASLSQFNDFFFLSANSNYIFFYDKKKRQSYILPKNEISIIETK